MKKSIKVNDANVTENLHFSRQSLKAVKKNLKLEEKEKVRKNLRTYIHMDRYIYKVYSAEDE